MSIIGLSVLFTFSPLVSNFVQANSVLGERKSETSFQVSPGVLFSNRQFATESTNQSVNLLEVNMADPFTKLNVNVSSPINSLTTTNVQALLNNRVDHQVVGAVNASFFETGTGFLLPANLIATNNQILHFGILSPDANGPNFQRNAFGITKDGKPLIDQYQPNLSMIHNGNSLPIYSINTQRYANEIVLYTPTNRYKKVAEQSSQWATEIVVTNASKDMKQLAFGDRVTGTVSQIVKLGEGANSEIPADGFVLSANGGDLAKALANINVGDEISLDIQIDSQWQDANYLIGTGPLLVKEGKVNINMNLSSSFAKDRHPRTAVAYSKEQNKVFLVTIDGRQTGFSNGVSLQSLAEYLISLGADRAINLDGGGSTTMLVRQLGYGFPSLVNRPSDGKQRAVSTTLQVVDVRAPKKVVEQVVIVDPMNLVADWKAETIRAQASITKNSSLEPSRNGQPALKLSYDLTGQTGTAAAYLVRKQPILFADRPLQVGAWVFGDGKRHWLRGTIYDSQGKQHTIDFTSPSGITWTGWRYVTANIPSELPLPLTLERMYVVQTNEQLKSKGTIYFDQIDGIYQSSYQVERFIDMKADHWALSAVSLLNDRNVIFGMYDGSFKPNQAITREQAAIMLVRELGITLENRPDPGFTDVTKSTPNYKVIAAVAAEGLFGGTTGNRFAPRETLTRAEMAVILQRAYKLSGKSELIFSDVSANHWAYHSVQALAANDVTTGFPGGTFRPNKQTTRAEFSAFMARLIE